MVARYGGEEFVVVLPGLPQSQGPDVAKRLRTAVMKCGIPHADSGVAAVVTVSVGLAHSLPDSFSQPDALVSTADAALYEAKHLGRNRCVVTDVARRCT
jgi:diguanylate cyclase (GGDEF)-like protein